MAVGEKVHEIAELWRALYYLPDAFDPESDFDRLFADGDRFAVGELEVRVMLSPSHTLGSITYVANDAVLVHDTLMYPDSGSSRADFPGGSTSALWGSIQAILALPADTRLFVGHDYGSERRVESAWKATVAEHLERNVHLKAGTTREAFEKTREELDRALSLPDRMLAALQVNLRGGRLPATESDGRSYLKAPVNRF